jgi:mRNA interferase RelE/StbE
VSLIYNLVLKTPAIKFIKKQDKKLQMRILESLEGLKNVPPQGDIKKLKGEQGLFRLRIGTFWVLFFVDHDRKLIIVEKIGNRGDIYIR